jgi:hypothetical protein
MVAIAPGAQFTLSMRRKYALQPHGKGPDLVFEWDSETGQVWGQDAEEVRQAALSAQRAGYAMGHPQPTPYAISDPLRRPGELAVVLGNLWKLPADLADAYPKPPADETPPGAIN